ncbi:hypothetical protein G3580_18845 [Nitrogeniibacter mangrovi]|uniref:Uncharacterized protein n=1 Tax=Nitrogeniibacter mangrovi TaxID=2016596 RepID=A0A6C1BB45_9RHOO|nr:hypothetical protein [Nitrogeniibacter mangrovi]QID19494.1 hypothetical protein G3580_18845 [Nitrogeniibacter mangrovi]
MNANPWSLKKHNQLRRLLVSLNERAGDVCEVVSDDDPHTVTLRHADLRRLRARVYLHAQPRGTYGIAFEFPSPVPQVLARQEFLSLPAAVRCLSAHFAA